MNQEKSRTYVEYAALILVMGLAFYLSFLPHQSYAYPVHIDEWAHLAQIEAILEAKQVVITDPFLGESTVSPIYYLESGFDLFWGIFHQISGLSFMTIFRYFPAVITMMTCLAVYVLARRQGFGTEAAFFTCLIPTTVGILGPAFLVPVAMGLLFVALGLFTAFSFRSGWAYLVLFIITTILLVVHAVTALGMAIMLAPYILINLKGDFRHSLGIALAVGIPCLAPLLFMTDAIVPIVTSAFSASEISEHIDLPRLMVTYGYLPVACLLLGIFALFMRGRREDYGLVWGALALLVVLATYYTLHYGIAILYYRGLMYTLLAISVIAGAGLSAVRRLKLPAGLAARLKPPWLGNNLGNILCPVLVAVILVIAIPARQALPYYHMIDSEDYQAFVWIRDNLEDTGGRAVLDPWKATAFVALTGQSVYTRIHSYAKEPDQAAYDFLESGCTDTAFLQGNNISLVYTRGECDNPYLIEVTDNVYLFQPE